MSNLIVDFAGMSLILSGQGRSDALLINTTDSSHKHRHVVFIDDGDGIVVEQAIMWIEQDGARLNGPLMDAATLLARIGDIAAQNSLHSTLTVSDPLTSLDWLTRISVWFRLPGGELTSQPTPGPGGDSLWEFPRFANHAMKKRQLTQFATLRKTNITGAVRLAIRTAPNAEIGYVDIGPNANGDYELCVATQYVGEIPPMPTAGTRVELSEMQLVYNCLSSPSGPIPSIVWPSSAQSQSAPTRFTRGSQTIMVTDPGTGICPIATVEV